MTDESDSSCARDLVNTGVVKRCVHGWLIIKNNPAGVLSHLSMAGYAPAGQAVHRVKLTGMSEVDSSPFLQCAGGMVWGRWLAAGDKILGNFNVIMLGASSYRWRALVALSGRIAGIVCWAKVAIAGGNGLFKAESVFPAVLCRCWRRRSKFLIGAFMSVLCPPTRPFLCCWRRRVGGALWLSASCLFSGCVRRLITVVNFVCRW